MKRIFALLIVALSSLMLITGCSTTSNTEENVSEVTVEPVKAVIEVNGGKQIELELYPDVAPATVENFVKLANEGFYDGLTFHRVIDGFMIQGGDPTGTGMGGSDETIVGEFSSNGYENDLSHIAGTISMARTNQPNSATSQFFITLEDQPSLDGQYAAFGRVVNGMEYVEEIGKVQTDANDKPVETQTIDRVYIVE